MGDGGVRKQEIMNRLKRIEGQIRGIQRMIEEGKNCTDILDQLAAARTALYNAGIVILENHTRECLAGAAGTGDLRFEDAAIEELVNVIKKFSR